MANWDPNDPLSSWDAVASGSYTGSEPPPTTWKSGGKIFKIRILDPQGDPENEAAALRSKQLLSDPFESVSQYGSAIRRPPHSMEQLMVLAEAYPIHAAALEQKALDVVGNGPEFVQVEEADGKAPEEQRNDMMRWLDTLPEQMTFVELLQSVWEDYETLGWGFIELARDVNGKLRRIYHVPGHTVRVHQDNMRYIQIRGNQVIWFKRWGIEDMKDISILLKTGHKAPPGTMDEKIANEVLPFVKTSRRSIWYGIPKYISAVGFITLGIAARDYNIKFFTNHREPRLIFIVSGLNEEKLDATLDEIEMALKTQHGDPHRNMLIPTSGDATVKIERVTSVQNDMQFGKLLDTVDQNILVSHRVPPDRLGLVKRGFLGGNVATAINHVYKDAVVGPSQGVLEDRINRWIKKEYALFAEIDPEKVMWKVHFKPVDVSDESMDTMNVVEQLKVNVITINEAREKLGLPEGPEDLNVTLAEFLLAHGGTQASAVAMSSGLNEVSKRQQFQAQSDRMEDLADQIQDLLFAQSKPEVEAIADGVS